MIQKFDTQNAGKIRNYITFENVMIEKNAEKCFVENFHKIL